MSSQLCSRTLISIVSILCSFLLTLLFGFCMTFNQAKLVPCHSLYIRFFLLCWLQSSSYYESLCSLMSLLVWGSLLLALSTKANSQSSWMSHFRRPNPSLSTSTVCLLFIFYLSQSSASLALCINKLYCGRHSQTQCYKVFLFISGDSFHIPSFSAI